MLCLPRGDEPPVNGVARILHSIGGHIRGEYVVHSLLRNDPGRVTTIECTLPAATIVHAPSVLTSNGYHVIDEDGSPTPTRRLYKLRGICRLDAAPFFKSCDESEPHPIHFDWSMLTLSRDRLSIRRPYPKSLKYTGDIMATVITRVINSRFCIMPREICADVTDTTQVAKLDAETMNKAVRLIENGWKMDDWLDGSNGWVLSRWIDIPGARMDDSPSVSLKNHSTCPLCMRLFAENDIVVNLPCNHNFHVNCHPNQPSSKSGLYAWLSNGHLTCPCCRAHVRGKPKCYQT